jgi:hypothetical protein
MSSDSFSLAVQHLIYSTKATLYAPWMVCNMSGITVRICPFNNLPPSPVRYLAGFAYCFCGTVDH